jgi:hypothetical protein
VAQINDTIVNGRLILSGDQSLGLFESGFYGLKLSKERAKGYVPIVLKRTCQLDRDSVLRHTV